MTLLTLVKGPAADVYWIAGLKAYKFYRICRGTSAAVFPAGMNTDLLGFPRTGAGGAISFAPPALLSRFI